MSLFRKVKADAAGYYLALPGDAVQENEMNTVKIAGKKMIVTRWQGKVIAFSTTCPHAAADLSQGDLYRGKITCPDHDYKFDIVHGRVLYPPDEFYCLQHFETKEEDGQVKIKL